MLKDLEATLVSILSLSGEEQNRAGEVLRKTIAPLLRRKFLTDLPDEEKQAVLDEIRQYRERYPEM